MSESSSSIVIWCFKDGRRGHESQSTGLLTALSEKQCIAVHDIVVDGNIWEDGWRALCGSFPPGNKLPTPVFHLGAGHNTHLPMLAARKARGGKIIVLMSPTLPPTLFDLCIVPEHDNPPSRPNILRTRGVLNPLRDQGSASPSKGLFLIGGPSSHYRWSQEALLTQIGEITALSGEMDWVLATSPRTPSITTEALMELRSEGITLAPFESVEPSWLPCQLALSSQVWVTEDSVSMIYEALTAGAKVGLLSTPPKKPSRVSRGVNSLIGDGFVTPFARWKINHCLLPPRARLDEASRCAQWISSQWL